jgi:AraC-like DNA-binding protein
MKLLIDTAAVPALQRVDFWAEESRAVYHPLEVCTDAKERFWARMWGDELASLGVFRIQTAPNTMSRTRRTIATGDPESLHLTVPVRGRLYAAQDERTAVCTAGDILLDDTSRPAIFRADQPFECVTLKIPRARLGGHAAKLSGRTAQRIPGTVGLGRLAARFFCGVAQGLADGGIARDDVNVAERVIDLVNGISALPLDVSATAPGGSRAALLLQAQAFIEANLADPDLAPGDVARACCISTRYLHQLFAGEGIRVGDWIRAARLDRCRRDLLDPAFADQTILAIGRRWGLPNAPHLSRLFRLAYGCSPREYRRTGGGGDREPTPSVAASCAS